MMGVIIVGDLLRAYAPLIAIVSVENIKAGDLPEGADTPYLLLRTISSVERQTLRRGAMVRTIDRVSVSVRARSYREQRRILQLAKSCCAGRTGDFGDARGVSILTAGTGPDLKGPGGSFEAAQDFRVSYDCPA